MENKINVRRCNRQAAPLRQWAPCCHWGLFLNRQPGVGLTETLAQRIWSDLLVQNIYKVSVLVNKDRTMLTQRFHTEKPRDLSPCLDSINWRGYLNR